LQTSSLPFADSNVQLAPIRVGKRRQRARQLDRLNVFRLEVTKVAFFKFKQSCDLGG
jgi:hypothetical protein